MFPHDQGQSLVSTSASSQSDASNHDGDINARSAASLQKQTQFRTPSSQNTGTESLSLVLRNPGQSPFFGGSRQIYHSPKPPLANAPSTNFLPTSQRSHSDASHTNLVPLRNPHDTPVALPSQLSNWASRSLSSLALTSDRHDHSSLLFATLSESESNLQVPRNRSVTGLPLPNISQIGRSSRAVSPFLPSQKRPDIRHTPPPKRVLRSDNSWRDHQSPTRPSAQGPPAIPNRSPLRDLLPRHLPTSFKTSRIASTEEQALWEEFSPRPLRIRRDRQISTSSNDTQEVGLKSLGLEVFAHRRRTLEILESSSVSNNPELHSCRLSRKEKHQRRSGFTMNSLHPDSAAALTAHRREAIRLAEAQQRVVSEKCNRSKQPEPDYTFEELIGKGSFGRVYKGRQLSSNKVVAIKVLDIDDADFRSYGDQKDEQIKDFNREIRILRQAQDSGAENLNPMIEAMAVHSQLWLICEHCPGGSVKTLMRATNDRLSEKFTVVVARELAKALKGLHEAGIMHRDVKAANVLIHQEGRLQLCDFGVATVLDTRTDKRRTFIGTLHWMPPELWTENPEYSDEVDVWEYGCTLYECAVGRPPNSDLRERQQLRTRMRRLKESIRLPDNEPFSDGIRSLVSYALSPDVASRPSMKDILEHEFLKETEASHPTGSLTELVQSYYAWLFSGGQRVSLFMPGGAAAAATEDPDTNIEEIDEWNFGITQDFERRVSAILEIPDFTVASPDEGEATPKGSVRATGFSPPMTQAQKANFEARVKRGADLSNLFDQSKPAYEYKTKTDFVPVPEQRRISDLPFRAMAEDRPSSIASNVIDLGDFDEADYAVVPTPRTDDKIQTTYAAPPARGETIRLADAATLREKRANSKGPRDPQNQSLTARRTSSSEAIPRTTSTQDFAASQDEWTVKKKAPELQEPAEIISSRPGHATMDWSFASAMSEATVSSITSSDEPKPAPVTTTTNETSEPGDVPFEQRAKKHATMDWSFSSAMAEANTTEGEEQQQAQSQSRPSTSAGQTMMNSSPPSNIIQDTSARPTPTRPTPLHRQITMPVTYDDFQNLDDAPFRRPSTAMSEAYSDISGASTDIDPFGLERSDDDHPGPATMEEDNGLEMNNYYSGRGRTLRGEVKGSSGEPYAPPSATTPVTASGPAPYTLGPPVRLDSEDRPRRQSSASRGVVATHTRNSSTVLSSTPSHSSQSGLATSTPPIIEVPDVQPPRLAALTAGATEETIEMDFQAMLKAFGETLGAAAGLVSSLEKRRERESDEWEDEE
ncbi:hypothetical protein PV10_06658 [Exophiala mesophila]|uniref:non-specific serine/threonine protein kinase n=1 Tax=Exophiala mesophila TaxID=212818 RepID=A0A0D1WSP2_EXOME|nr:uncharacterized protein PV10_06658 [Exophiala mesophila]KIV92200.1 hypothetical protein PV10_06658 [Exophiala mesophila]